MTNETKHTMGKWFWSDAYRTTYNERALSLIGADGYGILSCNGMANSPSKADARLIAQSPELLKTVEYIEGRLSDPPFACRSPEERLNELLEWIDGEILPMCTQVIAKAKGENNDIQASDNT